MEMLKFTGTAYISEARTIREAFEKRTYALCFEALQILIAWRLRSTATVPLSVELSELLMQATLNDPALIGNLDKVEFLRLENARFVYGLTITRFVNILSERRQQKQTRLTVVEANEQVGIPAWIVELRHNAVHRDLPPLESLREAIAFCWSWLRERYWKPESDDDSDVIPIEAPEPTPVAYQIDPKLVLSLFEEVKRFQKDVTKNGKTTPPQRKHFRKHANVRLGMFLQRDKRLVFETLYTDTLTSKDSKSTTQKSANFQPVAPLYKALLAHGYMPDYIAYAIERVSTDKSITKIGVKRVQFLIEKYSDVLVKLPKWKEILRLILRKRRYNWKFLNKMLLKPTRHVSSAKRKLLRQAAANYFGKEIDENEIIQQDAEELADDDSAPVIVTTETDSSVKMWQFASDPVDWARVPFGLIPGQNFSTLTLRLNTVEPTTPLTTVVENIL